jgi:hypothetical protein
MLRLITYCALCLPLGSALAAPSMTVSQGVATARTSRYEARIQGGSIVYFRDIATDEVLVQGKAGTPIVRFIEKNRPVTATASGPDSFSARRLGNDAVEFLGTVRHGASSARVRVVVRALDDELLLTGDATAESSLEGIASILFTLGPTRSHTEVIAPVTGGNRFPSVGLKTPQTFEWPISWEAAMVLVQGKRGGLLACAFEPFKRFKNLEMSPDGEGWRLALESENNAPFEGKRAVTSLEWRLRPYSGEWRKGAAIYREWHRKTFRPDIAEEPAWVKDIRAEVHIDMNPDTLDALVKAGVDPKQTLLYVASFRTNRYDVNYPDYTPSEKLAPFMAKAHALGFRVMLHVNHFGCDPKMPEYEHFRQWQFRHKYSGDLQWWEWPKGEFPTKFAYINVASPEWRKLFVGKMVELIKTTGADALHLDQTLCIFNDRNGLIGGMNSAEGNLLLHKEMKAALPHIALSGEGLDEVTMIHEAFAQRHVMGVDHASGTFNKAAIRLSHPISAYLFRGRTNTYSYLGSGSPDRDQFHQAWRDAYRHWGTLPVYGWPSPDRLANPSPSARQALDEIRAFQRFRLDPSLEGPWPQGVDFPFASASGETFAYLTRPDGWSLSRTDKVFRPLEDHVRTITGVNRVKLPGTIPGAMCYDAESVTGLDPERYYVYLPEKRAMDAFRLVCPDASFRTDLGFSSQSVAFARAARSTVLYDSSALVRMLSAYYTGPDGRRVALTGEVADKTGSTVQPRGLGLFMHPPWKGVLPGVQETAKNVGATVASFELALPKGRSAAFEADCSVDDFAAGKTDGVMFRAAAQCDGKKIEAEVLGYAGAPAPLRLDMSRFAGKRVKLDIIATAGPNNDPTCDWGLLERPRVTLKASGARCRVFWPKAMVHRVSPGYAKLDPENVDGEVIELASGGVAMATSLQPTDVVATTRLESLPQCNQVSHVSSLTLGTNEEQPIGFGAASSVGIVRQAVFAHPPDGGMRLLHYFIRVPKGSKTTLRTAVGLKDGSKSEGVVFQVWRNGNVVWSKRLMPADGWQPVELDLGEGTGEPMMLSLVTDSDGSCYYDWALWADPELVLERP